MAPARSPQYEAPPLKVPDNFLAHVPDLKNSKYEGQISLTLGVVVMTYFVVVVDGLEVGGE